MVLSIVLVLELPSGMVGVATMLTEETGRVPFHSTGAANDVVVMGYLCSILHL